MMLNPLLDIDHVFSLVIQQEREMIGYDCSPNTHDVESALAMQVNAQQSNSTSKSGPYNKGKGHGYPKGTNRICTNCGMKNHTVDSCYQIIGYPPGYKQNKGKNQQSQVNATSNASGPSIASSSQVVSSPSQFGFTQEQYQGIIEALQQSKIHSQPKANSITTSPFVLHSPSSHNNGKNSNFWILDTGATDHITFHLASFTTHHNIVPVPVTFPNGSQIFASIAGSIVISPFLTLHNVLYIPTFHVNLISVTKLAATNNCHLNFTPNVCHIL
jgi:hypothetical protein